MILSQSKIGRATPSEHGIIEITWLRNPKHLLSVNAHGRVLGRALSQVDEKLRTLRERSNHDLRKKYHGEGLQTSFLLHHHFTS